MGGKSSKQLSVREAEERCTPEELERYRRGFDKLSAIPVTRKVPRPHRISRSTLSMHGLGQLMPSVSVSSFTSTLFPTRPQPQLDKNTFVNSVLGASFPPQLASRVFAAFDNRRSGYLKYSDFIRGMAILAHGTVEEKCDLVFQIYDIQQTGFITEQDMMRIFCEDMIESSSLQAAGDLVMDCFEKYDEDKDGHISYAQLKKWAEENKNVTALTSWMLDESQRIVPSPAPAREVQPTHTDGDLLSSADRRRVDLRSNKSLSEFTHFNEKEVNDLERIFKEIKKRTPNGRLDREALGLIFNSTPGVEPLPDPLIDRLYYAFDDNMVGYIESREFICGLSTLCRGDDARKLKFWFEVFDVDKDQFLSKAEMLALVSSLWKIQALKADMDGEDELRLSTSLSSSLMTASAEMKVQEAENRRMEKIVDAAFSSLGLAEEAEPRISFEQFQEWFAKNSLALQFLDMITRMSNIVLGVRPSSARDEAAIVQKLMQAAPPRPGDVVFVLSNEWWQKWKESVEFDAGGSTRSPSEAAAPPSPTRHGESGDESPRPNGEEAAYEDVCVHSVGQISNVELLKVVDKVTTNQLKENLVPESDFVLVPERVWDVLWNWYGGGPAIGRQLILEGDGGSATLLPELYPYLLRVYLRRMPGSTAPSKMSEVVLSKQSTVKELMEEACARMMVPAEANVRVWDAYEEGNPKVLAEESDTLQQAKLVPGQKIYMEMQTEGGVWPMDEAVHVGARGTAPQPGQVGLHNLGNTCFMNSALQCLSHTPPLRAFFLQELWRRDLHRRTEFGARGELAKSYAQLMEQLWVGKNGTVSATVAPRSFKRAIGKFAPQFSGYQQHDAHELLGTLLDGLHEDLNRVRRKKYFEIPDSNGRPDGVVADECWEGIRTHREQSCVIDLMYGQLRSQTMCSTCSAISTRFDMFNCLQLPLPLESHVLLDATLHRLGGAPLVKYGTRVPSRAALVEVGKQVSALSGVPLSCLAYSDVRSCYFATHYTKYTDVSKVRSLHIYEVPPPSPLDASAASAAPAASAASAPPSSSDSSTSAASTSAASNSAASTSAASTSAASTASASAASPEAQPIASRAPQASLGTPKRSKKKKRSVPYVYVEVVMRYLEHQEVFFLSPFKPVVFGNPLLLYVELPRLQNMSLEELYLLIIETAGPIIKLVPGKTGLERFPFSISIVNKNGMSCAECPWNRFCLGCKLGTLATLKTNGTTLAADFEQHTMPLYYNTGLAKEVQIDESVARNRALHSKPITLEECQQQFSKEEHLTKGEQVYCKSCADHKDARKKIDVWRAPPILTVQLKRFNQRSQFLAKNSKLVSLPQRLDLSSWMSSPGEDEHRWYQLYAVLNHSGSLAGGHYIAYAKHSEDGKWYCYDDRRVTEMEASEVVSKNAYVLFYAADDAERWEWPDLPPPEEPADDGNGHCRFM